MADMVKTTFYLTGPLQGKTVKLRNYPFRDGKLEIQAAANDIGLIARFLEKNWQALPEGHAKVRKMLEESDGECNIQASTEQDSEPEVSGGVQPEGEGVEIGESEINGSEPNEGGFGETQQLPSWDGSETELNTKLQRAVYNLDPEDDSHWTQSGKPLLSAVAGLYGATDVTRADINQVAPGFTRLVAREAK